MVGAKALGPREKSMAGAFTTTDATRAV